MSFTTDLGDGVELAIDGQGGRRGTICGQCADHFDGSGIVFSSGHAGGEGDGSGKK